MFKKIIAAIVVATTLCFATVATPVMATTGPDTLAVDTAILHGCGDKAEDENGEGIKCLLKETLNILAIVAGAAGFAGIVWCGILYLTAGDNEEQVKKAKRRIFEIVIGVGLFLLANGIVQWLTGYDPSGDYQEASYQTTVIVGQK